MLVERSESKSEAEPASGWRQLAASYSSEHRRPGSPTFSLTRKFSSDQCLAKQLFITEPITTATALICRFPFAF